MAAYSKEMLCNVQMSRQPAFSVVETTGNQAAPSWSLLEMSILVSLCGASFLFPAVVFERGITVMILHALPFSLSHAYKTFWMVFEVTAEKQAQDFLKFSVLLHPRALSFNPSERECFTTARFSDSFCGECSESGEGTSVGACIEALEENWSVPLQSIFKVSELSLNFELGNICGKSELFSFLMVNVGGTPQYWKSTFKGENKWL